MENVWLFTILGALTTRIVLSFHPKRPIPLSAIQCTISQGED